MASGENLRMPTAPAPRFEGRCEREDFGSVLVMEGNAGGQWVQYEDFEALKNERRTLVQDLTESKRKCAALEDELESRKRLPLKRVVS